MIRSFRDRETRRIWSGERIRRMAVELQRVARRKLRMLNNAQDLRDLRIPPGNRRVPPRRVNEIVLGKRSVTPDTALRLARYFGTSERFWLGLQLDFDIEEARRESGSRIAREVKPRAEVG